MKNRELKLDEVYILNTFDQKLVKDWDLIKRNVGHYIIHNDPPHRLRRFPGLVFDSRKKAAVYYKYIFNKYINDETPPRGNLTSKIEYIFVGYKPGTKNCELSVCESAWLFGPTAAILNGLLLKFDIYPYFTNLAHDRYAKKFDLNNVINEIEFVKYVINKNFRCVFLGKFKEYDEVIDYIENKLDIECIRIWHPSYIMRNGNSPLLYKKWVENFKNCVCIL